MDRAPDSIWRNPVHFIAFGFGSGLAPKAPGTVGTLAAIPIWFIFNDWPLWAYLSLMVFTFILGCWLCGKTASDIGVHDHGGIVWDEFVGLWVSLIALPAGWWWLLLAFILFRVFDIVKPWPISWADKRVSGGLGIMLDDLLAGLLVLLVIQLLNALI